MVTVGVVQVEVLRLHRRRQHEVGEARRVGHALLQHDREEVVARQARVHARVIGVAGGRIGVEDDHRRDGRVVELGQRLAEARHVDRARGRRRQVRGHGARGRVDAAEVAARHAQDAAADVPEVARERGQRENRADRRAGTAVPLQPETDADRRGARVREPPARARERRSTGSPQISAARSTGHSASRASSSGQPSV